MKKNTIISTLVIGMLLSGGAVFAGGGKHMNGDGNRGQHGEGMTQEQHQERMESRLARMGVILDLTTEQKKQLEDLAEAKWQSRQEMRAEMKASRDALREYKQGKEYNADEFRALAQKNADLKAEMMVQRAEGKRQILAVLTPEQQKKAESLRELGGAGFNGKHSGDRDCNMDCDGNNQRGQKGKNKRCNK